MIDPDQCAVLHSPHLIFFGLGIGGLGVDRILFEVQTRNESERTFSRFRKAADSSKVAS